VPSDPTPEVRRSDFVCVARREVPAIGPHYQAIAAIDAYLRRAVNGPGNLAWTAGPASYFSSWPTSMVKVVPVMKRDSWGWIQAVGSMSVARSGSSLMAAE
jgi:hypothetical protein